MAKLLSIVYMDYLHVPMSSQQSNVPWAQVLDMVRKQDDLWSDRTKTGNATLTEENDKQLPLSDALLSFLADKNISY